MYCVKKVNFLKHIEMGKTHKTGNMEKKIHADAKRLL